MALFEILMLTLVFLILISPIIMIILEEIEKKGIFKF